MFRLQTNFMSIQHIGGNNARFKTHIKVQKQSCFILAHKVVVQPTNTTIRMASKEMDGLWIDGWDVRTYKRKLTSYSHINAAPLHHTRTATNIHRHSYVRGKVNTYSKKIHKTHTQNAKKRSDDKMPKRYVSEGHQEFVMAQFKYNQKYFDVFFTKINPKYLLCFTIYIPS